MGWNRDLPWVRAGALFWRVESKAPYTEAMGDEFQRNAPCMAYGCRRSGGFTTED